MPTPLQMQTVTNAIGALRAAENALLTVSRATNDPNLMMQVTNEYNNLDSILTQLVQAQLATDDAVFQQITAGFQQEAGRLQEQAAAIGQIVEDVALAGKIVGYITQAATFLAEL